MYDLLVKNGILIDAVLKVNERMDIAVSNGRVEDISPRISEGGSKHVVDATGMLVTPGLVDIHAHVAHNVIRLSVDPDRDCLRGRPRSWMPAQVVS